MSDLERAAYDVLAAALASQRAGYAHLRVLVHEMGDALAAGDDARADRLGLEAEPLVRELEGRMDGIVGRLPRPGTGGPLAARARESLAACRAEGAAAQAAVERVAAALALRCDALAREIAAEDAGAGREPVLLDATG